MIKRPFVCEINRNEAYRINIEQRDFSKQFLTYIVIVHPCDWPDCVTRNEKKKKKIY